MPKPSELRALELAFEELAASETASLEQVRTLLVEASNAAKSQEEEQPFQAYISFIDELIVQRNKRQS